MMIIGIYNVRLMCMSSLWRNKHIFLPLILTQVVFCCVSEDFISQSAANDGDVDRIERMRVCEELWRKCNDKIQVNFVKLCYFLFSVQITWYLMSEAFILYFLSARPDSPAEALYSWFVCLSIPPLTRILRNLRTQYFEKQLDRFWYKLPQVVRRTRARNDQLLGSGVTDVVTSCRSRSQ